MKLLFSITLIFISFYLNAQDINEFIIGEWEIIYFETNDFIVDKRTNSITYSEDYKSKLPFFKRSLNIETDDSLGKYWIENFTKGIFEFTEKGMYKRITDGEVTLESKFKIIPEENRIKYKYLGGKQHLIYQIEGDYLNTSITQLKKSNLAKAIENKGFQ